MRIKPPRAVILGLSMAALAVAMASPQAQEATATPAGEPVRAYDHTTTQTITFRDGATPGANLQLAPEKAPPSLDATGPLLIETPDLPLPSDLEAQTPAREATTVADALKQALDALVKEPSRNLAARREREAVATFYAARAYAPLWFNKEAWTDAARSALARLEHADGTDSPSSPAPCPC